MNKEQLDSYKAFAKEKLGFEFNDINLLVTALTHRSYVNEHRKNNVEHNERLEFLGDAVLELVSSDYLFKNYDEQEGIMTSWRAALVNTEANATAGEKLGYGPLVRLSNGEKNGSLRAHHVIMADCYEAIIGAIYLDQGYKAAEDFILKNTMVKIGDVTGDIADAQVGDYVKLETTSTTTPSSCTGAYVKLDKEWIAFPTGD